MKYFNSIKSADDLRKAYRAMCLTMHPDRGGNEEEFKTMQAEFEALKKRYQDGTAGRADYTLHETAAERAAREEEERREREEWARWEAEEKARREQEKREEAGAYLTDGKTAIQRVEAIADGYVSFEWINGGVFDLSLAVVLQSWRPSASHICQIIEAA